MQTSTLVSTETSRPISLPTAEKLTDCYEVMMNKINSLHAMAELGSIADFDMQLEPESYTRIFTTLEIMIDEIRELAVQLEKSFFKF